jgi:hypothetical protein
LVTVDGSTGGSGGSADGAMEVVKEAENGGSGGGGAMEVKEDEKGGSETCDEKDASGGRVDTMVLNGREGGGSLMVPMDKSSSFS